MAIEAGDLVMLIKIPGVYHHPELIGCVGTVLGQSPCPIPNLILNGFVVSFPAFKGSGGIWCTPNSLRKIDPDNQPGKWEWCVWKPRELVT